MYYLRKKGIVGENDKDVTIAHSGVWWDILIR